MVDKVLVLGASGATGKRLVGRLLDRGADVVAVVRNPESMATLAQQYRRLRVVTGEISAMAVDEVASLVKGCNAVACCLGHRLSFQGIYGEPRRLVTEAIAKVCSAIEQLDPERPIRVILMNTTGNRNRDINEAPPLSQRAVIGVLRLLLPPHADNECAADYLRVTVGQTHPSIEWAVLRPDTLTDDESISDFELCPSPTRNVIFDAGKSSRINVADCMATFALCDVSWRQWKGQMPVLYNR